MNSPQPGQQPESCRLSPILEESIDYQSISTINNINPILKHRMFSILFCPNLSFIYLSYVVDKNTSEDPTIMLVAIMCQALLMLMPMLATT
jgi:hypothetical protein